MQDQVQEQQASEQPGALPAHIIEAVRESDVVVMISSKPDDHAQIVVKMAYAHGFDDPNQIATHAYAHALKTEHRNLMSAVCGIPTDADRYRALREFSMLAKTNPERFELVNDIIHKVEVEMGMTDDADERTADQHDAFADIVHQALIETAPSERAPATEVKQSGIILPH